MYECTVSLIFGISILDILSLCKAEEESNVYPLLTDNNTADGNIGSVIMLFINDTVHDYEPRRNLVKFYTYSICQLNEIKSKL